MSKSLVVLGSANADHVVRVPSLPRPGETVSGYDYQINPGGKGANQAVACTRLGGHTTFITCIGEDAIGAQMLASWQSMGMNIQGVQQISGQTTGVALISVDDRAENSIAIAPGANGCLNGEIARQFESIISAGDYLLMQLETPLEGLQAAATIARNNGTTVVLNPAPAKELPVELLACVDLITPNQSEVERLTGITVNDPGSAAQAAASLHALGIEQVIITMGKSGAWASDQKAGISVMVPSFQVKAVDTTAAGDTFNGALLVALSEGQSLTEAVKFASAAAAISVTRPGAQSAVPSREETLEFLRQH